MSLTRAPYRLSAAAALAGVLLASPVQGAETAVTVTRSDCARLVTHVPDPGVAYQPGVDVRGRPVAPADLGGTPRIKLPEEVEVPVTLDMLARYGLPANSSLYKLDDTVIGTARVRVRDGRAWFNGEPLGDEESFALALACQNAGKGKTTR
jgi:hypothetical protein